VAIKGQERKSSHPSRITKAAKKKAPIGPAMKSPISSKAAVKNGKIHLGIECSRVNSGTETVSSHFLENSINPILAC
jgi:hypothetical protein